MKYDDLNLKRIREVPIFDVCSKLGISLYGMGKFTKRATCWYHDDKHPSMHVNKTKNIYKCFVCGKGGDVIKLVQDYDNKSFIEACDWLVNEFQVVLIEDKPSVQSAKSVVEKKEISAVSAISAGPKQSVVPLSPDLVTRSLSLDSQFCKSAVSAGYLSQTQLSSAANRYRLGCSKEGGVIFWEIDDQQRVHTGKIMYYLSDCHRDKEHKPTWVHHLMKDKLPANYELQHCLFGLHLISDISAISAGPQKIAIVESEKSAVILSEKFPDFLWLSCGGLQSFKPQLLEPLVNHKVIIFPDTDPQGEAFRMWTQVALEAQRLYNFRYPLRVSPLLESQASYDQKQRKIDLVDFLYETQG
ncbi:DUF6371 domain-containing protein [Prevotella sp. E13-27]|uniref:DUF6371 domain-containing protein n=1 Tax=Prevotella sp. E13-27 TaxID=2938122 RepID=UPI00200B8E60|nr:DUF6371 domain-containing protein [Prevotella sp. E13-27]MCK8622366.1 DUF6371 domain-containing protein [Prevotella sp. E13-27]